MTLTGFLGRKLGMTQVVSDRGEMIPVTVIETPACVVTQVRTPERDGYHAVQLGAFSKKHSTQPELGHFKAAGLEKPLHYIKEIRLEGPTDLAPGKQVTIAEVISAGDHVNVSGVSIGKGFAGTVKRYHFNRGPMSHGSKFHRLPGSSGSGTTPGRVLPGSRRAGHMGARKTTAMNLEVIEVNAEKGYLLVRGSVPGPDQSYLVLKKRSSKTSAEKKS